MNKSIVITVIVIILAGGAFWAWQAGLFSQQGIEPVSIPEGILLFYGEGCPHCENVDEFIAQNNIAQEVQFTELEVYYNADNQNILAQVAQKCGISTDSVGVPFLYDGENCMVGDQPIIDFFAAKLGIMK